MSRRRRRRCDYEDPEAVAALKGCATWLPGGVAISGRRRNAASALLAAPSGREFENRSAGAPTGEGTDSSQATGAPRYPNDPRPAPGPPEPEPPS